MYLALVGDNLVFSEIFHSKTNVKRSSVDIKLKIFVVICKISL